jgi:hypothetical protein
MKTLLMMVIGCMLMSTSRAQVNTLDIVGMHQLIDQSKSEHDLQVDARNRQATNAANEKANMTLLAKLKNTYRTLQQRYNTLGTAINIANIGLQATPMVRQIISYQSQVIQAAGKNPALIALGLQTEIEFVQAAESLLGYITGLTLSLGDVNQMKASDRKMLFDYVISELSKIQELSGNLTRLLQYNSLASVLKALNPFQNFINQDKYLVGQILQNAKYL